MARPASGCHLFPELVYAMFLNLVYVKGILDIAVRRQAGWKHVVQNAAAKPSGAG